MTDNTQELDEILDAFASGEVTPHWKDNRKTYTKPEAKQAILDWHNKQVEAKLAHISEYAENAISIDENGEFSMKAIPLSLVAVERNKLKEATE